MRQILVLLLLLCAVYSGEFEPPLSNSAITHTRQINIPGYPNAYNPSLVPYQGGYLLSFRAVSKPPETVPLRFRKDVSVLGVVQLDKQFTVIEETVQLLDIVSYAPRFSLTAEDARLVLAEDRILIVFNDLPPLQGGFAMYVGELIKERGLFVLKESAKLLHYASAVSIEKNWSPFFLNGKFYTIYADSPRIILEVDLVTGLCQEAARTFPPDQWKWGCIRGGTPAYLVDDQMVTFFHSSVFNQDKRVYVMGAYTFDQEPPFAIRSITPIPLGNAADYTQGNSSKVVFPGGMVVQGNQIFVAWGKGDKKVMITTFDKGKLLASMRPIP